MMLLYFTILFLLTSVGVDSVMKAVDSPDRAAFEYQPLRPLIHQAFQDQDLHADMIGRTAQPRTQCGVILMETSALLNGDTFKEVVLSLKMAFNSKMEYEIFKSQYYYVRKEVIRATKEMLDGFTMGIPENDEGSLASFSDGILLGLGGILQDYAHAKITNFFTSADNTELLEQIGWTVRSSMQKLGLKVDDDIRSMRAELYDTRYRFELGRVYDELQELSNDVLTELFIHGRIHNILLKDEPGSVWHAVQTMVGNSFNSTILSQFRTSASKVIRAKVVEKARKHLAVQVCFPAALLTDVDDLLEVAPLGHFSGNDYSFPILPSLYSLSEKVNEVSDLRIVRDLDCPTLGDITICPSERQHDGCSLLLDKQTTCDAEHHNGTDGNFVLVRPLTFVSIVATNAQSAIYKDAGADREEHQRLTERLFVATIPHGSSLQIGETEIKSRISSGNISLTPGTIPILPPMDWKITCWLCPAATGLP